MKFKDDFVHLHVHSDMSQLDGGGTISDYINKCVKIGQPAIAFTEHGTMRGIHQQYLSSNENNIKPIYGIEFYVSRDMLRKGLTKEEKLDITKDIEKKSDKNKLIKEYEEINGIRDRWHITVWAKNDTGLKNLYKLSSMSYIDGFYYKPRIDLKTLSENSDGLMVGTGCLASPINERILSNQIKKGISIIDDLYNQFGEDLYLEIQPHDLDKQRKCNKIIVGLKDRYGKNIKLVATQDAHYVEKGDHVSHEVLLCIGTKSKLSDPNHFCFDGDEFWLKNRSEMYESFKKYHPYIKEKFIKESLDTTLEISEKANIDLNLNKFRILLPPVDLPKIYNSNFEYLKELCKLGWEWREIEQRSKKYAIKHNITDRQAYRIYIERLKHELRQLKKQKFVSYFLIVEDLVKYARKNKILLSPGRGSAAGSFISFLLGITSLDPIEHGLMFERFINPNRVDLPDIDLDFEDIKRQKIIEYLKQKYGEDKVAQITTLGKLSGKSCLKDVSKVLDVPYAEANQITNSLITRTKFEDRAYNTIEDSFKKFEICKQFNKKYPNVLKFSKKLEGLSKVLGIHAGGVVISPVSLDKILPLEIRKNKDKNIEAVVTSIDKYGVEDFGLVKFDILGVKTLTILKDCLNAIEDKHSINIDLEKIDINDQEVLKKFTEQDFSGVFQYDSPSSYKLCEGIKFESFEDIAALTALNRPGTTRSGLAGQYINRKKNPHLLIKDIFHPEITKITSDTLGVMVYQEHILKIFINIAGFDAVEADKLRKKISKSQGDEILEKERVKFVDGVLKNYPDIDEKTANEIMDAIVHFGSYGFNKSHATAYALLAYWCMYLKLYYPIEFYWSTLKNEDSITKMQQLSNVIKNNKINLCPPDVSVSKKNFFIDYDNNTITSSLIDIKGIGEAAVNTIVDNQPYSDFLDFIKKIDRRKCNKKAITSLAKAGALDKLLPNKKYFIENIDYIFGILSKKNFDITILKILNDSTSLEDYSEIDKKTLSYSVNSLIFDDNILEVYGDFISTYIKVPVIKTIDDYFYNRYNNKGVYLLCNILDVKFHQIGDYHSGDIPNEAKKKKMFWGNRYAKCNIETIDNKKYRVKFDIDVFDSMQNFIETSIKSPVILHVLPKRYKIKNQIFDIMNVDFGINLPQFREKIKNNIKLDYWERFLIGSHPIILHSWKNKKIKDIWCNNENFYKNKIFCGVITHIRNKIDKNNREMAFFGVNGVNEHIEVIAFNDNWQIIKKSIKMKKKCKLIIDSKREYGMQSYFFNGGFLKILKDT